MGTPRLRILVVLGLTVATISGLALVPDRSTPLRLASSPGSGVGAAEESTTSTLAPATTVPATTVPATTSTTSTSAPSTTSTTSTSTPSSTSTSVLATTTSTTEVHRPSTTTTEVRPTTTTTVGPSAGSPTIACETPDLAVTCAWRGLPAGTDRQVLMREEPGNKSQPRWETTDLRVNTYRDEQVRAGTTYVYRISAYTGDRLLATSNPVRVTPGGAPTSEPQPTVARVELSCAASEATAVTCTWSSGPDGTVAHRLSRRVAGTDGAFRVVATERVPTTRVVDRGLAAGTSYEYVVHALGTDDRILGIGGATISCCSPAATSR